MIPKGASAFARDWAAAWNARDVEAVLRHFHPEAVFSSPIASRLGRGDGGVLRGKDPLREYWVAALALNPDLHFEVVDVYAGVDMIGIVYSTQSGEKRLEVLTFQDGLVIAGSGTLAHGNT